MTGISASPLVSRSAYRADAESHRARCLRGSCNGRTNFEPAVSAVENSPHLRDRLKPENRCLVPANSFAEYAPEQNPETKKKDVVCSR
jgi:hypothetical protein